MWKRKMVWVLFLIWITAVSGDNENELTVRTTVPGTIKEWVENKLCTNPDGGIGVSDISGVTTLRPFVVSLTLPYSAVRGETLPVIVTVFNNLTESIPMELRFRKTDGFEFRDREIQRRQICLHGSNSESVKFNIIPSVVGAIDIEVTAVSNENYRLCNDEIISDVKSGVSDCVQGQLLIEAEGVPQELTWSSYICVNAVDEQYSQRQLETTFLPTPTIITVQQGETAVLVCQIKNLGTKNVIWRKEDIETPLTIGGLVYVSDMAVDVAVSATDTATKYELIITDTQPNQAGKYMCQITSKIQQTRHFTLQVNEVQNKGNEDEVERFTQKQLVPTFLPTPTNITVRQGETAVLTCLIRNLGPKIVIWRKEDSETPLAIGESALVADMAVDVAFLSIDTTKYELIMTDTQPNQAGTYLCQISSSKLYIRYFTLQVHEVQAKVTESLKMTGKENVTEKESIIISCNMTKATNEHIEWFFDGTHVDSSRRGRIMVAARKEGDTLLSELKVKRSRRKDSGTYVCRSSNFEVQSMRVNVIRAATRVKRRGGVIETRLAGWDLPQNVVPDTYRATVSVVGDIMGPTLSNLNNLLRMPYGCGEQNMALWAQNIYVLKYLSITNQLTQETKTEAKTYMSVGYQRQLMYRHVDNSYSAWGETGYTTARGSLWLTAFVVKSMAHSSDFISVDTQDILNSARWLVDKQNAHGCFPPYGKVFTSYMKGGIPNGENLAGLTAFTLIALLEANLGNDFVQYINGGFGCLEMFDLVTTDTYTLSLMFYAYTLHGVAKSRRSEVNNELRKRQISSDGMIHWKREETEEENEYSNTLYLYRAPSAEVEMTAYVLLSMLEDDAGAVNANTRSIVQWLTKQRNPYGGFSSTQDTVVALQALAKFGQLTYLEDIALTVDIKNPIDENRFIIAPDNKLLTQSYELSGDGIEITTTGSGCVLAQVNVKYNVYTEEATGPAFEVNVEMFRSRTEKSNCARRSLSVCARYLKSTASNMAIAEVKMPTGWIPIKNSLTELVKANDIQRTDVDTNYVQLYFDELTNVDTCVEFELEQDIIMNPKPALVKVYDYYETSYSVTTEYEMKTTCGTKEEIPLDNKGVDCDVEQCREEDTFPLFLIMCPVCPSEKIEQDAFLKLACGSHAVYNVIVGRRGAYSMKIKANIRDRKRVAYNHFLANYEMAEQCLCPILNGPKSRALIFTEDRDSANVDAKTYTLTRGDTLIPYERSYVNLVRRIAKRKKLCLQQEM